MPLTSLSAAQINNLVSSLTGNASAAQGGQCAGLNYHDNVPRGYVTVDVVNGCNTANPGDSGYFVAGGNGTAMDINILTGEVFYVDPSKSLSRGNNLVHIHASNSDPLVTTSGNYTFYGGRGGPLSQWRRH